MPEVFDQKLELYILIILKRQLATAETYTELISL